MSITLARLEILLAEESEKIDDLRVFGSVSPDVYALLYIAARTGSIDIVDALFASRHCEKLMKFISERVLTSDDFDEAVSTLSLLCSDHDWSTGNYFALAVLQSWSARELEKRHFR